MIPSRRRLLIRSVALALSFVMSSLLAMRLGSEDPIAEVLLGRAGSTVPLMIAVLVFRLAYIVVFPPLVAMALLGVILERFEGRGRPGPKF